MVFTYTGDIRVPVVEGQEVLDEGGHDWNLLFSVVVHDLDGQLGDVRDLGAIVVDLLSDETVVVGEQGTVGNGSVVGAPVAVELHGITSHSVAGVIGDRVVVLRLRTVITLGRIGYIVGITVRTVVDGILNALVGLTTQEVVNRAVLHAEEHDILNLVS